MKMKVLVNLQVKQSIGSMDHYLFEFLI
uniref:Uncharacterized protein n=1 Tax=Rhizophora mucronata TaxID=61149 RepID=A0A2P2N2F6_RHIMU